MIVIKILKNGIQKSFFQKNFLRGIQYFWNLE